mmetsp:Transcript_181604/g.441844  ORF Transcript_181604/g.441844 Transcript_181604/m.441844 type:complete len:299 (+) Transcript_181604:1-897(+)
MTSGEAAAAAAEKAISAAGATVEMHADSKLRNLKSMIVIRLVKWLVVLLVFSCVAGSNYHLLNLDQENTVDTIFKTGLWRVKSAVSFTVAWGVFMWIFEGIFALLFIAWREGYVDPTLNNKFDINNLSIVLLTYDALCFFLIIVAGFNMGAAAGIPASAVELLLKQDGLPGVDVSFNCTAETLGLDMRYVDFPVGNTTDYQNLRAGPLTAGVFLLIVLVHLEVLSLMQDYLWLLTDYHGQNSPAPDMSANSTASADAKDHGVHTPVDTDDSKPSAADAEGKNASEDDDDVVADAEEAE